MKRFLTLTLCAILLLCSCNSNTTTAPVQTSQTEEKTSSVAETTTETTAVTTTAEGTTNTTTSIAYSLSDYEIVTNITSTTTAETKTTYHGKHEFSPEREYYGAAGELLEFPPESEWKSLAEIYGNGVYKSSEIDAGFYSDVNWIYFDDYSILRYPTGVYYDTERTPELYENGAFIGEKFYDYGTEWIKADVGDSFGNLTVNNAKVNYFYGKLSDEFIWSDIDISFEGEAVLDGIIYMFDSECGFGEDDITYYFTPYPVSLFEQSFPMLKETSGTFGFSGGDGYCMGGDTIDIVLTKDAISESAMNELNEFGYCKMRSTLSNVKITGVRDNLSRGYCFANLIDFETIS